MVIKSEKTNQCTESLPFFSTPNHIIQPTFWMQIVMEWKCHINFFLKNNNRLGFLSFLYLQQWKGYRLWFFFLFFLSTQLWIHCLLRWGIFQDSLQILTVLISFFFVFIKRYLEDSSNERRIEFSDLLARLVTNLDSETTIEQICSRLNVLFLFWIPSYTALSKCLIHE